MTWGLEIGPFENGHDHFVGAMVREAPYGGGTFCVRTLAKPIRMRKGCFTRGFTRRICNGRDSS